MHNFNFKDELIVKLVDTGRFIMNNATHSFHNSRMDLTMQQTNILLYLSEQDGMPQSNVIEYEMKAKPNVTRMLKTMENKNLIKRKRNKNDNRSYDIFLKEKGKRAINKIIPMMEDVKTTVFNGLSEEEQLELRRMLDIIINNTK